MTDRDTSIEGGSKCAAERSTQLERRLCLVNIPRERMITLEIIVGTASMAAVHTAGIANENRLLLYDVTALSVSSAGVNGVLVVEASADRVAFDDLVAHGERMT